MNPNFNTPAFPAFPAQDNLGRIITHFGGMSKRDHFALEILKSLISVDIIMDKTALENIIDGSIMISEAFINRLDNKEQSNENTASIITM